MADGATADPKQRHFVVGTHVATGRADGQYLNWAYQRDRFSMRVGVDGEGFWIASGDNSALITVTLLQSSITNDIYDKLLLADSVAPGGLLLPLAIIEQGQRTAMTGKGRILKRADGIWSDGGEVYVWTFGTTNLLGIMGGLNPTPLNPNP